MHEYLSLFAISFIAATLLPAGSELVFAGLLSAGRDPLALWGWATAGNTLGAVVNWWLGRFLLHYQGRPWLPFPADGLQRAQHWFGRYGVWSLLFAWAPLVGDALTFVAEVMRVQFPLFLLLTALGKGVRYAILLWLVSAATALPGH